MKPDRIPKFRCHQEVSALKIAAVTKKPHCQGAVITSADVGYGPVEIDDAYLKRHKPSVGGYYVVYEDGCEGYCPAWSFESLYDRI
jgi:hypothetical protein